MRSEKNLIKKKQWKSIRKIKREKVTLKTFYTRLFNNLTFTNKEKCKLKFIS